MNKAVIDFLIKAKRAKFCGKEEIFYRGEKIYECLFHGGAVE